MPGSITISNPQNRVKDCYAPAPKINLTLRSNGEEAIMIMDALAQWTRAGFTSPVLPPSVVSLVTAGTFVLNKFWGYAYVYVAKRLYPLVENAVTGGGSPAPRSNPSPYAAADSTINTNAKRLDIPTSQRYDISHIWIYRTTYFDTAVEAADFGAAGNMFWIGEIENNPNLTTVPFVDNAAATGLEQIENDNFSAPQFSLCVYADPFFWGIGNSIFEAAVTVTTTGLVTLNTAGDKWYDGRNSQTIIFDGITSGGYDGHGSFYFKQIDNTTAQLYQNIGLTSTIGLSVNGTTRAYIRGPATVLYRSKPRNPFSWGQTDLIGDVQVPEPYQFSVGGGNATAIAVIPNLNLLKIDTESPNRCYTLNLKNAGTPNFESSLRAIADNYCVSNQHSQFSAILERGQNVLWGVDSKGYAIVECDSASQQPISSMVFRTMRNLSQTAADRLIFHGCYCPRSELNCIFIRTKDGLEGLNKVVFQHGPTGFWGTIDVFDVLCSAQVFDRFTGQMKMFVGTETGFVGEMFAEGQYHNWFVKETGTDIFSVAVGSPHKGVFQSSDGISGTVPDNAAGFHNVALTAMRGLIGNWVTIRFYFSDSDPMSVGYYVCRIGSLSNADRTLNFDKIYQLTTAGYVVSNLPVFNVLFTPTAICEYYIGLIDMQIGRSFNANLPSDSKKIEEVWSTWRNVESAPSIEFTRFYLNVDSFATGANEINLLRTPTSEGTIADAGIEGQYSLQTKLPIDVSKLFGIIIKDRSYTAAQIMNYDLRLNNQDHGGNN